MKKMKRGVLLIVACLVSGMMQAQLKVKKNTLPQLQDSTSIIYTLVDSMAQGLNCRIVVKEASISTTMNARPSLWSLMRKKENRKYVIRVNNNRTFNGIRVNEVPTVASIGLWVHELMHVKDYHSRNMWGIMERGWQYMTINGKRKFEHEIDQMVISHGFGNQLFAWAQYAMEESNASPAYKAFKRKIYLSPTDIQQSLSLVE